MDNDIVPFQLTLSQRRNLCRPPMLHGTNNADIANNYANGSVCYIDSTPMILFGYVNFVTMLLCPCPSETVGPGYFLVKGPTNRSVFLYESYVEMNENNQVISLYFMAKYVLNISNFDINGNNKSFKRNRSSSPPNDRKRRDGRTQTWHAFTL
ncbi:hypothetical protein PGB90_006740 [Kerria lacca]